MFYPTLGAVGPAGPRGEPAFVAGGGGAPDGGGVADVGVAGRGAGPRGGGGAAEDGMADRRNVAIGAAALLLNEGEGNVAIGGDALRSNTAGSGNVAVGYGAGIGNGTGSGNV